MEQELNNYKSIKARLEEDKEKLERSFSSISTMRIISFVIGVALTIVGVSDHKSVALVIGVLFIVLFFVLVFKHGIVYREEQWTKNRLGSVERYIGRFNEDWRSYSDNGEAFLHKEDVVARDVDLLGANSLYQLISVCHTDMGRELLADELKLKRDVTDNIDARRQAVRELVNMQDFAIDFEAAGMQQKESKSYFDAVIFSEYCKDKNAGIVPKWARILSVFLPLLEFVLLILFLCGVIHYGYPLVGFMINLAFTWLTKTVTDRIMSPFYQLNNSIDGYIKMLDILGKQNFDAPLLKMLRDSVCSQNGALQGFKRLGKIMQAYNVSYNPLVHQILSGLILWDYQLATLISEWKGLYGENACGCFDAIAQMELLLSLSVMGKVRNTCEAHVEECTEGTVEFCGVNIYHPLIKPETVVANSALLNGGVTIITGSNMSGKTTFLRTIAINLALAYIGAPVCGEKFSTNYMKLFTSMRVTDDVAGGISTFYAEILRIKAMAEYRKNNMPMICLVDEIFKGTNSADRIVGASEVIRQLGSDNCMTIVSTHDFELCTIKDKSGKEAVNYHFEEYYDEDTLKFDYKIKNGRCTTTNARAILRMAGFDVKS
ncbi:MAG: DNA mismatch repair protein MutS [Lachnospiraceae bacterium]|nr:DNA mismatch repair protein MutS [Lachnospiraceae bacterium]